MEDRAPVIESTGTLNGLTDAHITFSAETGRPLRLSLEKYVSIGLGITGLAIIVIGVIQHDGMQARTVSSQ